uniref:Uncharacterized protein n=1 Tax=Rhizophora mucronata TaxID=61149 RepID=A0A2P2P7N2_RHIMU
MCDLPKGKCYNTSPDFIFTSDYLLSKEYGHCSWCRLFIYLE